MIGNTVNNQPSAYTYHEQGRRLGLRWSVSWGVMSLIIVSMTLSVLALSTSRTAHEEEYILQRLSHFLKDQPPHALMHSATSRFTNASTSVAEIKSRILDQVQVIVKSRFIIAESALYDSPRQPHSQHLSTPPHPQNFMSPSIFISPLILPLVTEQDSDFWGPKYYEFGVPTSPYQIPKSGRLNQGSFPSHLIIRIRSIDLWGQLITFLAESGLLLLSQMMVLVCFALYLSQKYLIRPLLTITQLARELPDQQQSPELKIKRVAPELLTLQSALIQLHRALRDEQKMLASAYRKLQEQERLITAGYLSARVMHELGNPLASVSGLIEFLRDDSTTPDEQRELLELALGELRRMKDTSRMLQSISHPQSTHIDHSEVTSASELVEWSKTMLRYHELYANIDLIITGDLTLRLQIASDPLKHALLNLILNAAHAQKGIGMLWVDIQSAPSPYTTQHTQSIPGVRLILSDQGPGLAHDRLTDLLNPSGHTLSQHNGMGLSIARESIEQNGGHLWVYSAQALRQPDLNRTDEFPGARFGIWAPRA